MVASWIRSLSLLILLRIISLLYDILLSAQFKHHFHIQIERCNIQKANFVLCLFFEFIHIFRSDVELLIRHGRLEQVQYNTSEV
jgi:hypothetical protein